MSTGLKWFIFMCLTPVVLLGTGALVGNTIHEYRVMDYVRSDGVIYSWMYYSCDGGVMYRSGRSSTLMVDISGKPKRCSTIKMTNGEFEGLLSENK